jgi:predicted XRE-type DNA-binding protein
MRKMTDQDFARYWEQNQGKPGDSNDWVEPKGGPRLPVGYYELLDEARLDALEAEMNILEAHGAGGMLRLALKERKKTQRQVSEELGVGQARVSQLVGKGDDVELSTLKRVAEALGYDLEVRLVDKEGGKTIVGRV